MEIKHNATHLQDIFSSRYQNVSSPLKTPQNDESKDLLTLQNQSGEIEDKFLPSKEYSKILEIKEKLNGGFKDVESFKAMAKVLKDENIINNDDMIAIDFLADQSPKLSFDEFNKILQNDNLSKEMKGLISDLVAKLEMIDYLSNNALAA